MGFFLPLSGKERGHTQNEMSVQRSTYNKSDNTFESASDKLLCNVGISVTTLSDKIGSVTHSAWLLLMSGLGFENQTQTISCAIFGSLWLLHKVTNTADIFCDKDMVIIVLKRL